MPPAMETSVVHCRSDRGLSSVEPSLADERVVFLPQHDKPVSFDKRSARDVAPSHPHEFDVDGFYQCQTLLDVLWAFVKESWYSPLLLVPVLVWIVTFACGESLFGTILTEERRPDVSTAVLPKIDGALGMPHQYIAPESDESASLVLDLISSVAYGLHIFIPGIILVSGWFSGHIKGPSFPMRFFFCLGSLNLVVVITQIIFPVAPPWHYEKYGPGPHSREFLFGTKGDPAGLARFDDFFGISYFHTMYANAPIVYGSFPSLHAAWPVLCAFLHSSLGHTKATVYWTFHSLVICWSAMYLLHHFLADVIAGVIFSWAAVKLGDKFYRWYTSLPKERRTTPKPVGMLG